MHISVFWVRICVYHCCFVHDGFICAAEPTTHCFIAFGNRYQLHYSAPPFIFAPQLGQKCINSFPWPTSKFSPHSMQVKSLYSRNFILDLNFGLNRFLVDYELQLNQDLLQQFVITDQVFEDGLTKDNFIRTLKRVFKSKLHCIWLIDKTFGRLPPRPSNENDMFI